MAVLKDKVVAVPACCMAVLKDKVTSYRNEDCTLQVRYETGARHVYIALDTIVDSGDTWTEHIVRTDTGTRRSHSSTARQEE
jgi:hypothetical protein